MAAESRIERATAKYATEKGWVCRKFVSTSRRGVLDHIFINPEGTVWFIEFKAPGKKPTPLQLREIRIFKSVNANAIVVDNIDDGKKLVNDNS